MAQSRAACTGVCTSQDDPHKGWGSPEPPPSSPASPLMKRGRPLRPGSAHRFVAREVLAQASWVGPCSALEVGVRGVGGWGVLERLSGNLTVGFGNHSLHKGAEQGGRLGLQREVPWKGWGLRKAPKRAQGGHHPQREPTLEHLLALAKPLRPGLYKGNPSCSAKAQGQARGGTLEDVSECQTAGTWGERPRQAGDSLRCEAEKLLSVWSSALRLHGPQGTSETRSADLLCILDCEIQAVQGAGPQVRQNEQNFPVHRDSVAQGLVVLQESSEKLPWEQGMRMHILGVQRLPGRRVHQDLAPGP